MMPTPPPPILRYFTADHLTDPLAEVSAPFCRLARAVVDMLPDNTERAVALRKLLEAKDAAVRAAVTDYFDDAEEARP